MVRTDTCIKYTTGCSHEYHVVIIEELYILKCSLCGQCHFIHTTYLSGGIIDAQK